MYGRKRAPRPAEEVKIKLPDNVVRLSAVGTGGSEGQMSPPQFLADQVATPIYSRSLERKNYQAFWLLPKFSLVLGLLKSRISKNSLELLLRKLDFKLFHYKARVQPVSKITTIATRNRCWM